MLGNTRQRQNKKQANLTKEFVYIQKEHDY